MKNKLMTASVVFGAVLLAGCAKESAVLTNDSTAQQLDKAQAATKDAVQEMQDFTYGQKTEFVATMKTKMTALERSLDELSAKIEKSGDAVQSEARPKLAALREQVARLNKQMEALQNATPTTWDNVKAEAQKTYASLEDGFNQARQWVSEKIAP